jgi:hypothetical protein
MASAVYECQVSVTNSAKSHAHHPKQEKRSILPPDEASNEGNEESDADVGDAAIENRSLSSFKFSLRYLTPEATCRKQFEICSFQSRPERKA